MAEKSLESQANHPRNPFLARLAGNIWAV
jgi:hypothetical protein